MLKTKVITSEPKKGRCDVNTEVVRRVDEVCRLLAFRRTDSDSYLSERALHAYPSLPQKRLVPINRDKIMHVLSEIESGS